MKNIMISLVCGLFGAMIFTFINNHFYSKPIAVVNLNDVISEYIEVQSGKDMTVDEQESSMNHFVSTVEESLKDISEQERVTLLTARAVISDVPDYTQFLKNHLKDQMEARFDTDSHSIQR